MRRKSLRLLLLMGIVVAVLAIVLYIMSQMTIKSITITGNVHNSREEILHMVGFDETSSVLHVLTHRKDMVRDISYVSRMEIDYIDFTTVHIKVYEKEIIGYVSYMGKYLCLDGSGYIVDYTQEPDGKKPQINGIDIERFTIDAPLEVDDSLVSAINMIYRNSQTFEVPIDEIRFVYGKSDQIILQYKLVEVRLGSTARIEEKFQIMKEVFSTMDKASEGILYLEDVDAPIVFRAKDEQG